jgi:hypothetical protein
MRLPLVCMQCVFESVAPETAATFAEYLDDNVYEIQCPKGHKEIKVAQQDKFEILFEIGAHAIRDGYYREAVSSFASSIERFYEFFIRCSMHERGSSNDTVSAAWKMISAQSERQLGAYIFLYTQATNSPPPLLAQNSIQFRNDVIHKGRIPKREEALDFGEKVLCLIREGIEMIKKNFPDGLNKTVVFSLQRGYEIAAQKKLPTGTLSIPTIVGLNIAEASHHSRKLEQAIKELRNW